MARTSLFRFVSQFIRKARYAEQGAPGVIRLNDQRAGLNSSPTRKFSRRSFVKGALCATGAYSLPTFSWPAAATYASQDASVAIIGAGLSGLTAAYRLMQLGIAAQVLEAHPSRIGGRIWTKRNFNNEGMYCELGAELVDTDHKDMQQLCSELGLVLQPLQQYDNDKLLQEFYFINNKLRDETDVIRDFQPLAKIINDEIAVLNITGDKPFPSYKNTLGAESLDRLTLKQWLEMQRGKVEDWILKMLEIAYVAEMGTDAEEQSALNLLLVINTNASDGFKLFGKSDQAFRIQGGSDTIISALHEKIKDTVPIYQWFGQFF